MARQTFGDNVRYYRTLRGLGQEQLAQRVGKSVPTISRIENGSAGVTLATIIALAVALDAEIKDLVDVENPVIFPPEDNEILVALMRKSSRLPKPLLQRFLALVEEMEENCNTREREISVSSI